MISGDLLDHPLRYAEISFSENLLRTKIDSVIDIDAFNAELEDEKTDAAEILLALPK